MAYLETTAGQARRSTAGSAEIRAYPEVAEVTYVSRQEAYQRFQQRLGSDADLLEGLGAEVLPASLEVRLKPERRQEMTVVAERLGAQPGLR